MATDPTDSSFASGVSLGVINVALPLVPSLAKRNVLLPLK
jgi:hypothetical protein